MFEGYLAAPGPKPPKAEALLRLGKAQRAIGNPSRARDIFREILSQHNATAAAVEAKKLLRDGPSTAE